MGTNGSEYYIFVNSEDRLNKDNSFTNPFTVELRNLNFMYNRNVRIGLDEAYFSNMQYPIRRTNNKFLVSDDNVNFFPVEIPEGSYTPAQLATTLKSILDSSPSAHTYQVVFNDITKKFVISVPLPDRFTLDFRVADSAHKALGYADYEITDYLSAQVSANAIQIDADFVVYLETNFAGTNVLTSNRSPVFEVISLGAPYGGVVQYKSNESNNFENVQEARLSRLTFTVRNPDGTIYNESDVNTSYVFKLRVIATDYDN
jgi:hypothetical protein